MSREPEHRQITTHVRSPIELGMDLEEIEASEVQILFDGDLRETKEISLDKSKVEVVLTFYNTGEHCIEMIAEGRLPEEMDRLQQQSSLEVSPPKAHAAWDVTVESSKQQDGVGQVWRIITNLLALREVVSIVRNRWGRVGDHLEQPGSEEVVEEEDEVNMTLDEFRKE